jgi:uncharacterized protein YdaU (DUF1376 family)
MNGIKAAATHSKAVLMDHFSLNQIEAGSKRTKSYAYDLGAQNKEAAIAIESNGIFGRERNRKTTHAAMTTRTAVNRNSSYDISNGPVEDLKIP